MVRSGSGICQTDSRVERRRRREKNGQRRYREREREKRL
jgi:hypothetical protein